MRDLDLRARIVVAVLEKLVEQLRTTTIGASADDDSWPDVGRDVGDDRYSAALALHDLLPCYEELAMAIGREEDAA